jgi:cupin 2 domain-containing protein
MQNVFSQIPQSLVNEEFLTLLEKENLKIERIVSDGQVSPEDFWYDQQQHEWLLLLQGEAELEFTDKKVKLKVGDFLEVPAHCKHRVSYTSTTEKTIWLAIFWS